MGKSRVKGIVVEIGGDTIGLNKALDGTNKKINATQSNLKDVERLLKLDPTNTKLLEQKQRLLGEAISETEEKLQTLNKAHADNAAAVQNYDAWKQVYDPIKAEIDETREKLKKLKKQQEEMETAGDVNTESYQKLKESVDETSKHLKELKDKAEEVTDFFGRPISQEQFDALQREIAETELDLKSLRESAEKNLDNLCDAVDPVKKKLRELGDAAESVKTKADGIADKFQPVTAAVAGLATAAVATVPATEELREDLSKLDANAKDNAVSVEAARKAWKEFAIQSGETDSAVEAVSNLLQANFTESNLQKAVEGLAGAAQRFPDTLKIESLADSLQETLASGEATGQFSELLSRLGMDVEVFSENLAACTTEAERQDLVLKTLADAGLNESYEAWKRNNEAMLANKDANLELELSMAELAEKVMPVVTEVTAAVADFIGWFSNLPEGAQMGIIALLAFVGAISPVASAVGGAADLIERLSKINLPDMSSSFNKITGTTLPGVQTAFSKVFGFIAANPIVLLIGAIIGLVALIATKGDEIQGTLQNVDDFVQNVFVQDWTEVFGPVLGGILNKFLGYIENWWNSGMDILNGIIDFIRGIFTGDWERAWEGCKEIFSGILDGILAIFGINMDDLKAAAKEGLEKIKSFFSSIEWKLPRIKLPHFSVSGSFDFSSFPPSVPKIAVDWYAKGGILKGAQLFGWLNGSFLGGGENGPEAVLPLSEFYTNLENILQRILFSWPSFDMFDLLEHSPAAQALTSSVYNNTTHLGGININVYGSPGQDVHELAEIVMEEMQHAYGREEAALA